MVCFLFDTGLRVGEAIALKWEDVEWASNRIHVQRAKALGKEGDVKNRRSNRFVRLTKAASQALRSQQEHACDDGVIFRDPKNNQPWKNSDRIRKRFWEPAIKKAGVRHLKLYATRHTYASIRVSANHPWTDIIDQMGHSGFIMLDKHYATNHQSVSKKESPDFAEDVVIKS